MISLSHPANSPDLNPIENTWALLKRIVGQMVLRATNLDMLWEQVQRAWADIPQSTINRYILSLYKQVEALRLANGNSTRW